MALRTAQQQAARRAAELEAIASSVPVALWSFEPGGRRIFVSPRWEEITGVPVDVWDARWQDHCDPQDAARVEASWAAFLAGEADYDELYHVRDGRGRGRLIHEVGRRSFAPDGRLLALSGYADDVTDRVAAARDAERRAGELEALARTVPLAVWSWTPDGQPLHSNGRWQELSGQPASPAPVAGWLGVVHPDDRERMARRWRRLGRRDAPRGPVRHSYRIRHAVTGEELVLAEQVQVVRDPDDVVSAIVGATWDITEESRAEAEVRRHAAELDALAASVPAAIWRVDREGRVRFMSERWERITGQPTADALGDGWLAIVHPEEREAFDAAFVAAIRAGEEWEREYRIELADGEVRWLLDYGLPVDHGGGVVHHVGSTLDVTERHLLEERRARHGERQATVAALGRYALDGETSRDDLLRAAAEAVGTVLDVPYASVMELLPGGSLQIIAAHGVPVEAVGRLVPPGEGSLAARAVGLDEPVWSNDPEGDGWSASAHVFEDLGIVAGAAVPVRMRSGCFGALAAYAATPRAFAEDEVRFLEVIANTVGSAIQRDNDEELMRRRALHDDLTGLPNRALFLDRLERALERAQREEETLAVLFLDLDDFKVVNDTLGHEVGDQVLEHLGSVLVEAVRPEDTVARFGGDEFVVLCDGIADESVAVDIARRITAAVRRRPVELDEFRWYETGGFELRVSIGVAVPRDGTATAASLLRDADTAMYQAKATRDGEPAIASPLMRHRLLHRVALENELRGALAREEFVVFYQPVVRLRDGELAGFEALVRWRHPERGLLQPGEFIPLAEELGLIVPISNLVLRTAAQTLARWNALAPDAPPITISVNLATQQVVDAALPTLVEAVLRESGVPAAQLALELTETGLLGDTERAATTLQALHGLGVRLLLDDFGQGYSSIAYLERFPMDGLKIDRATVALSLSDGGDGGLVRGIALLAGSIGLDVVAEGIEDATQLRFLRDLGVAHGQGYHLGRPLPRTDAEALVVGRVPFDIGA